MSCVVMVRNASSVLGWRSMLLRSVLSRSRVGSEEMRSMSLGGRVCGRWWSVELKTVGGGVSVIPALPGGRLACEVVLLGVMVVGLGALSLIR